MTEQKTERRSGEDRRKQPFDIVEKPVHYNTHPSGIETIDIVRHLPFSIGNAIKYMMRAPYKGTREQDYRKALWYLKDAIRNPTPAYSVGVDMRACMEASGDPLAGLISSLMGCPYSMGQLTYVAGRLSAYIEQEFGSA